MLWGAVLIAVIIATGLSATLAFGMTRLAYGHPVRPGPARRAGQRRDERRFVAADVRELDEAFRRVIRGVTPG